ncbi:MAG TPA: 30S ribosomal protein S4 [bacterium]|nr:30S ribosomal protein S4 [bacterium]HEX68616.1 30S ribosomal protein S4 [bacterium]
MGRYTGPVCRLCRREGVKLYLKGEKCDTPKCPLERRPKPPGVHGDRPVKLSDYGMRLREKQKLKRIYGMREEQFRRFFDLAQSKKGVTGEVFLTLLERRLDNVVYRMGFAASRRQARQLVSHGFFQVNGKKVDIPSYLVKEGDIIEVRENKRSQMEKILETVPERPVPEWLTVNRTGMMGRVIRFPTREEIDVPVQEHLIVELYSR